MSGHSKWKNIMHKKEKTDLQRAKVFTKIGKEIAMAVRDGGPDPVSNGKLRDLIAKAKANNVPNDNIERTIKKASGADGNVNYEVIMYEGYGPSGVAVIVETTTDNRNRTGADMRHYFDVCSCDQLNCAKGVKGGTSSLFVCPLQSPEAAPLVGSGAKPRKEVNYAGKVRAARAGKYRAAAGD